MTTDHDIHEPPALTPDAAVDAPRPEPPPDHTTTNTGASQPDDEAIMRAWEGLPPDTMILAPVFAPPPMRCPDDVWAMLVTAVDIIGDADPDRAGEVALFAGTLGATTVSCRQPVRRRPRRATDPPGRLGEVQGLQVSLEAARTKLTSLDRLARNNSIGTVNVGMPIIRG